MANRDGPYGFRPHKHLTGGEIRTSRYKIATGLAENIRTGDAVEMTGTGRNIALSAAGNVDTVGVFAGVQYVNAQGEQKFAKMWTTGMAGTEIEALVWDDPNILFKAQCDTLAEGDVGALADLAAGTGSDATGNSGAYVDVGSGTATTGKSIKIMELLPRVDNAYGAYAECVCLFVEQGHSRVISGTGGV